MTLIFLDSLSNSFLQAGLKFNIVLVVTTENKRNICWKNAGSNATVISAFEEVWGRFSFLLWGNQISSVLSCGLDTWIYYYKWLRIKQQIRKKGKDLLYARDINNHIELSFCCKCSPNKAASRDNAHCNDSLLTSPHPQSVFAFSLLPHADTRCYNSLTWERVS